MSTITEEQAEKELKERAKKVSEEDLNTVLEKREEIEKKFTNGALSRFVADLKLLFAIIQDYVKGKYKEVPFWTIAAIVAALLYVLSPIDLIPDFIPGIGFLDDALVVAACLAMVQQDLKIYKKWKEQQE